MGWIQAGELSADRAGALVGGLDAKLRLLATLSAALPPEQREPDPYEAAFDTHPPLGERMRALRAWRRDGGLSTAAEINTRLRNHGRWRSGSLASAVSSASIDG